MENNDDESIDQNYKKERKTPYSLTKIVFFSIIWYLIL